MGESPVATAPPSRRSSLAELISTDQSTNKHCHHSRRFVMKNYGILTGGLIIAWFVLALAASALHVFTNNSNRIGFEVGIAALVPIFVFALWFVGSKKFREFTLSLNPRMLTLAQSWRIIGFIFVFLEAKGVLPAVFALPAGYGDM